MLSPTIHIEQAQQVVRQNQTGSKSIHDSDLINLLKNDNLYANGENVVLGNNKIFQSNSMKWNESLRIMCMIFTTPGNWETKAKAVRLTWAKRCSMHMFFYSRTSAVHLPNAFALDVPEGRDHLTAKTMTSLRLSFENYKQTVDWFLKADDDTYIIMENLKHLLAPLDPRKPHYVGGRSLDFLKHGYNGGGAGYLLSWEAARSVVEESDRFNCALDRGYEDLEIGKCLENFHIYPIDTRDSEQRLVFHPDHPIKLLAGEGNAPDVYTYTKGNVTFGNQQVNLIFIV